MFHRFDVEGVLSRAEPSAASRRDVGRSSPPGVESSALAPGFTVICELGTDMGTRAPVALYVVLMVAVIVGVDFLFFRNRSRVSAGFVFAEHHHDDVRAVEQDRLDLAVRADLEGKEAGLRVEQVAHALAARMPRAATRHEEAARHSSAARERQNRFRPVLLDTKLRHGGGVVLHVLQLSARRARAITRHDAALHTQGHSRPAWNEA